MPSGNNPALAEKIILPEDHGSLVRVAQIRTPAIFQRDEFSLCTSKFVSDMPSHAVGVPDGERMAVLTPTTLPPKSSSGPPKARIHRRIGLDHIGYFAAGIGGQATPAILASEQWMPSTSNESGAPLAIIGGRYLLVSMYRTTLLSTSRSISIIVLLAAGQLAASNRVIATVPSM